MEMGQQARLELTALPLAVERRWRSSERVISAGERISFNPNHHGRRRGRDE